MAQRSSQLGTVVPADGGRGIPGYSTGEKTAKGKKKLFGVCAGN